VKHQSLGVLIAPVPPDTNLEIKLGNIMGLIISEGS
jgi:hypothetical protein